MCKMPRRNSLFRLESCAKKAAAKMLARHGIAIIEGITAFLEETTYEGNPAVAASKEARMHAEKLKFNAP